MVSKSNAVPMMPVQRPPHPHHGGQHTYLPPPPRAPPPHCLATGPNQPTPTKPYVPRVRRPDRVRPALGARREVLSVGEGFRGVDGSPLRNTERPAMRRLQPIFRRSAPPLHAIPLQYVHAQAEAPVSHQVQGEGTLPAQRKGSFRHSTHQGASSNFLAGDECTSKFGSESNAKSAIETEKQDADKKYRTMLMRAKVDSSFKLSARKVYSRKPLILRPKRYSEWETMIQTRMISRFDIHGRQQQPQILIDPVHYEMALNGES
ncbi:hypothetical protein BC938DRAFT_476929 [Jimgerdemannia flammicorona]|uniref:Uncharacterized protein n=1 Tax=Jimgerdemannia flammicorona TaxID=994334 RepID=A0A433PD48_9FUNG|nr:hypothetical protein BC938DRAFT_476929 [Jimgerdemannia flammicorona]